MPRGAKIDRQATKEAQFLSPKSFVSLKGNVYLAGKDMEIQRMKVFEASKGRCESSTVAEVLPTEFNGSVSRRCPNRIYWETFHMHHLIHRGKGGSDDLDNLAAWCPPCHLRHHGQAR